MDPDVLTLADDSDPGVILEKIALAVTGSQDRGGALAAPLIGLTGDENSAKTPDEDVRGLVHHLGQGSLDHLGGDGLDLIVPGVVVAGQTEPGGVEAAGAGQLGFTSHGHANQIKSPTLPELGLGFGGELRPLDDHALVALLANLDAQVSSHPLQEGVLTRTGGLSHGHMDSRTLLPEEGLAATHRVDVISGQDQGARLDLLTQGTHGRGGPVVGDALELEGVEHGGEVEGGRGLAVLEAVTANDDDTALVALVAIQGAVVVTEGPTLLNGVQIPDIVQVGEAGVGETRDEGVGPEVGSTGTDDDSDAGFGSGHDETSLKGLVGEGTVKTEVFILTNI